MNSGTGKRWDGRDMQTKMGREIDSRHLFVKSPCFAQLGIRSAACRVMFPQQSLETNGCENIRERDNATWDARNAPHTAVGTVDGRNIPHPKSSMLLHPEMY